MRILVADKLPPHASARLRATGADVIVEASLRDEALTERIAALEPNVLIVRSTKVGAAQLEASEALALVIRAGAGVNTIDTAAAAGRAIHVANCPGKNADAVAELTFALLLAIDRMIPEAALDLRGGHWDKARFGKARGLKGRTLGLLGLGGIGAEVARRAAAFGMPVVAWSRSLTPERAAAMGVRRCDSPEDVARRCDILSAHLALTPDTRGSVGEAVLQALPAGAVVINTSRAEIVDAAALLRALDERGLWAGLDVFPDEPGASEGAFTSALAQHPRVVGTPHIGASTEQSESAVADEACRIVEEWMRTGVVHNSVNLSKRSGADHLIVVRHYDRVGVLAGVLAAIREADHNVQEMENVLFSGGKAAAAHIQVRGCPSDDLVRAIRQVPEVFSVRVRPR